MVMFKQWSLMSPLELFQGDDTPRRCKIMNLINKLSAFWLLHWPAVPPALSLFPDAQYWDQAK